MVADMIDWHEKDWMERICLVLWAVMVLMVVAALLHEAMDE